MGEFNIELDGDIIKAFLTGVHLRRDIDTLFYQIKDMVQDTKNFDILLDVNGIEEVSGGARRTLAEYISSEPRLFNRLALCGEQARNRVMANFIITASGKSDYVRYFENAKEALEWLRE